MNEPQAPVVASDVLLGTPIGDYLERGGTFLFWTCPNKCGGSVDWRMEGEVHVAKCGVCGTESIRVDQPNPKAHVLRSNNVEPVVGTPNQKGEI